MINWFDYLIINLMYGIFAPKLILCIFYSDNYYHYKDSTNMYISPLLQ